MSAKYTKIVITLIVLNLGLKNITAQEPMALYYMETIPQSNLLNPAMSPRCNGFFGVPGVNTVYTNFDTDLSTKAFLQQTDSGTVSLLSKFFDYKKFNRIMGNGFNLRNYTAVTPLTLGFRGKNGYFTFALSEKVKVNGVFPTDFFNILDNGLPSGTELDFSDIGVDIQAYQEFAMGYSRNFNNKVKVGARVKLLNGFFSLKTDIKDFTISTSKQVWDIGLDGAIHTNAPLDYYTNENGFVDSVALKIDADDKKSLTRYIIDDVILANRGIAFDLGAVYNYDENWTFSASLIDLGFIRWTKGVNSLVFNGSSEFRGFEINNIDSIGALFNEIEIDSLVIFDTQLEQIKYSTDLGTNLYLGAEFNVNHYLSLGLISRTVFDKNYFSQEFNASTNFNLYHILSANLNYNLSLNGENYAGLGLGFSFVPLQFYILFDHLPVTFTRYNVDGKTTFAPYELRSFNVMVGLNFVFGAKGFVDKPKVDVYSEF